MTWADYLTSLAPWDGICVSCGADYRQNVLGGIRNGCLSCLAQLQSEPVLDDDPEDVAGYKRRHAGWPESPILSGGWSLTTDHSASSYGQPVLVSPAGDAYGPGDLLTMRQVAELWGRSYPAVRAKADLFGFGRLGDLRVMSAAQAVQGPPAGAKRGPKASKSKLESQG